MVLKFHWGEKKIHWGRGDTWGGGLDLQTPGGQKGDVIMKVVGEGSSKWAVLYSSQQPLR